MLLIAFSTFSFHIVCNIEAS